MSLNKFLLLCIVLFSFSSCFEIVEEVNYKTAESGTYILTANLSKSKVRLKGLMKVDTFMGVQIPHEYEINQYINKVQMAIKATPGITALNATSDFENFIFTLTFDFDKTENLNLALNNAAKKVSPEDITSYWNIFGSTPASFTRHKLPDDSLSATLKKYQKQLELISGSTITSVYRFPKEIKTATNGKSLISKNKKAVMLKQNIPDVILNPQLFTNTITF